MHTLADFHLHSTCSDGTDDVITLVNKVKEAGITWFSLTDHDTMAGCEMAREEAQQSGLRYINGIEFSCVSPYGKCHMLGYHFDMQNIQLKELLVRICSYRHDNLLIRLHALKERYGILFSAEQVRSLEKIRNVGRPHIAQELVRMGLADNTPDAFGKYLTGYKLETKKITAEEVIRVVHHAGGVVFLAHPFGEKRKIFESEEQVAERIAYLKEHGLNGLEVYYSQYREAERRFLLEQADKYGLLISGGSDYHGTNKSISIGSLTEEGNSVYADNLSLPKLRDF